MYHKWIEENESTKNQVVDVLQGGGPLDKLTSYKD